MSSLNFTATELVDAFDRGEFVAFVHPFVHPGSDLVLGAELLARWIHPTRGVLAPGLFLEELHALQMVRRLTDVMLTHAARLAQGTRFVSVNLSTADIIDPRLVERIEPVFAHADPTRLCVEVLEVTLGDEVMTAIHELNERGVQIAVDDFGTAFSSLARVIDLQVDIVKLDRSLIANLEGRPRAQRLLSGFVGSMHELGTVMLAEGVETDEELAHATALGCDLIQGYLYGRPVHIDRVAAAFCSAEPLTATRWRELEAAAGR